MARPRTGGLGGTSALSALPDHALHAYVDRKTADVRKLQQDLKKAIEEYVGAPAGSGGDKIREALEGRMRDLFEQIDDLGSDLRKTLGELIARVAERRRKAGQAAETRYLEDKSAFSRWLEEYDRRRQMAKKLEEIEKFLESLELGRLANLAFLNWVGAIDGVGGFAPTDVKSGATAEAVEKQVRLIERPKPPRARTDRLRLGKATTGRLDATVLSLLEVPAARA
ncbi:MAG: hypothetical protein FJZ00_00265 [Candidatus Sericytochromatia bacterium]|uniref:Uncharacterized protein n=1 Tax=Candidatus Tanganyikabacteria bacterium TaxID=2961651 RepID=A0A937X1I4_9BACT|nr:hypothetical protein [Candidatus Tanganyikabacteria bacterium]